MLLPYCVLCFYSGIWYVESVCGKFLHVGCVDCFVIIATVCIIPLLTTIFYIYKLHSSEIKASAGKGRKGLVQRREAEQQAQLNHSNHQSNRSANHTHQNHRTTHSKFHLSGMDNSYRSESMEYDEHNTSYNNTSGRVPTGRKRNSKDTGLTPSVENFHLMSPGLLLTSPYPFGRTPNGGW